jgi:hypothetical protein
MVSATPSTLPSVLIDLVKRTAIEAGKRATDFEKLLQKALPPGDFPEIPHTDLKDLKPEWWSIIAFVLNRIADLDRTHLRVSAWDPGDGWCKALALGYMPGSTALMPQCWLAFCLTSTDPTRTRKGIIVRSDVPAAPPGPATPLFDHKAGNLSFRIDAHGKGEWRFPFDGPVDTPQIDKADIRATLIWRLGLASPAPTDDIGVEVGPIRLEASVDKPVADKPWWTLRLGLGDPDKNLVGLRLQLSLTQLVGDFLAPMLQAEVPSFTPAAWLEQGRAPGFDLGAKSTP